MQPQAMLAPKSWIYSPKYSLITTRLQEDTARMPVAFCCASENTNDKNVLLIIEKSTLIRSFYCCFVECTTKKLLWRENYVLIICCINIRELSDGTFRFYHRPE